MVFKNLRDRPTSDLVVVFLAGLVGLLVLIATIGVAVVETVHPESDTDRIIEAIVGITDTLVGAVVGYVAGRGATSMEDRNRG